MLTLDFRPLVERPDSRSGREVHVWRDRDGEVFARAVAGSSSRWIEWAGLGVFAFTSGSGRVLAWPAADADAAVIAAQFTRFLEPVILQALGWQTLHAGAVLGAGGVIACCGEPGAGKSTTTYALARRGWTQIADDTVVLSMDSAGVTAHPLPFSPRFRENSYEFFGGDAVRFPRAGEAPISPGAPLRATIILRQNIRQGWPVVTPVEPASAFSELLTHACTFDSTTPDEVRRLTRDYLEIASRVPVFTLAYRPDLERLPAVLDAIDSIARELGVEPAVAASST